MASERRTIRRKLGVLALTVLAEVALLFIWLPVAVAFPLALAGLWAVDHYFIGWMDLAFRREGHAARGAEAEETVGSLLNRLPEDCVVLHDVVADFGNIDHVVFRKDGAVFVIETKAHGGRVTEERGGLLLNGRPFEKDILKQTHGNIYWLRDFLKARFGVEAWITAAIVFPNAYVAVRHTLRGVDVMNGSYLQRWMTKARGNPRIAQKLWPQVAVIKAKLLSPREPRKI